MKWSFMLLTLISLISCAEREPCEEELKVQGLKEDLSKVELELMEFRQNMKAMKGGLLLQDGKSLKSKLEAAQEEAAQLSQKKKNAVEMGEKLKLEVESLKKELEDYQAKHPL